MVSCLKENESNNQQMEDHYLWSCREQWLYSRSKGLFRCLKSLTLAVVCYVNIATKYVFFLHRTSRALLSTRKKNDKKNGGTLTATCLLHRGRIRPSVCLSECPTDCPS